MCSKFTAIVLGATGLVGSQLVSLLTSDPRCGRVITLGRRLLDLDHEKLQQEVIDFEAPGTWRELLRGDVLFSALGTTRQRAGSLDAQHRVDHTYQLRVAEAAAEGGVPTYVLVSALGANPRSLLFYSRMKGELERDVLSLGFRRICILRPGLLDGERTENRPAEQLAQATLRRLPSWGALAKIRPIPARVVAQAALEVAFTEAPVSSRRPDFRTSFLPGAIITPEIYEPRDLFRLGQHREV